MARSMANIQASRAPKRLTPRGQFCEGSVELDLRSKRQIRNRVDPLSLFMRERRQPFATVILAWEHTFVQMS